MNSGSDGCDDRDQSGQDGRDELFRLRMKFIAGRRDIAWWPREPEPGGEIWFYRPGELLAAPGSADEVAGALRKLRVRFRIRQKVTGGATLFVVATRDGVPELCDAVDRQLDRTGDVAPNHVLFATPRSPWGPAGDPRELKALSWAPSGQDGRCVRVGIVDTGLLPEASIHPFLTSRISADADDMENKDIDRNNLIDIVAGHGTFVAGVVRRNAPGATLLMERALNDAGFADEVDLGQQLVEVLRADPDIINLSVGTQTRNGLPPLALQGVWDRVVKRRPEIVVVASAGNQDTDRPFWPAASQFALGVGAVDDNGNKADFSNFGVNADVWAPGVDIENAYCEGTYRPEDGSGDRSFYGIARWDGTSFAAPYVVGAIAARMTRDGITAAEARDRVVADAQANPGPAGPVVRV